MSKCSFPPLPSLSVAIPVPSLALPALPDIELPALPALPPCPID